MYHSSYLCCADAAALASYPLPRPSHAAFLCSHGNKKKKLSEGLGGNANDREDSRSAVDNFENNNSDPIKAIIL